MASPSATRERAARACLRSRSARGADLHETSAAAPAPAPVTPGTPSGISSPIVSSAPPPSTDPSAPPTPGASQPRPFRVLGLQQIAIGGPSKAALRRLWVDLFGVPATDTYRSE